MNDTMLDITSAITASDASRTSCSRALVMRDRVEIEGGRYLHTHPTPAARPVMTMPVTTFGTAPGVFWAINQNTKCHHSQRERRT